MKYIASFIMFFILSASSVFAQNLPCGVVREVPKQVVVRLNELDTLGVVTHIKVHVGPAANFLNFNKIFVLPSPNEDGTYTVSIQVSNSQNSYVAVSAVGPTGTSSVTPAVEVPAVISGACPAPHTPTLVSVLDFPAQ